jgi:putative transposase
MWLEDNKLEAKFVIHDRDTKFSFAWDRMMFDAGVRRVRTPLMAPDANSFIESWIGSIKRECLNHFLCFGLGHLDYIAQAYVRFYNTHRPHTALGDRILDAATGQPPEIAASDVPDVGRIRCRRFLGGLLRHYYREAA